MFQHLSDKPFSRMPIFSILLMAGLFAIISAPAQAITITGNTPVSDATNVATDSDIVVKFDQSVAAATVEADMFAVKGSSSRAHEISTPDVSGSNITIQTETEFIPGETVTVTVSPGGIEDTNGNSLTEPSKWEWKFVIVDGLSGVSPEANAVKISATSKITLKFSKDVVTGTVSSSMFSIGASVSGSHGFEVSISKNTVTLTPAAAFVAGESVSVTVNTSGISLMQEEGGTISAKAETRQWQFVIASSGNTNYLDSGQSLGGATSNDVAIGDVDGDGDIDAFVVNAPDAAEEQTGANVVWKNNNEGDFSDSGQTLGTSISLGVMMKDLDGDGDIDAFVTNVSDPDNGLTGANKVWKNNGKGTFTDSGQNLGTSDSYNVVLGDLDADGDMDAFVVNFSDFDKDLDGANKVWRNDGSGNFADSGQSLGTSDSHGVALGDLDGDGDLDAFVANYEGPDKVWKNNGSGVFTDSGQALGNSASRGVSLGDLDRDGDLDAFVCVMSGGNKIWLNSGNGSFSDSGQSLGNAPSYEADLKDIDGDGNLDAFVANALRKPNALWLNDGKASFSGNGQSLGGSSSAGIALSDLDGDNDLDAFVANYSQGNRIWLNNSPPEIEEGSSITVDMDENAYPTPFSLTLHASDTEGGGLSWSLASDPEHGRAYIIGGTGDSQEISYIPDDFHTGTDSFEVQVSDGADSSVITVNVDINPNVPEITEGDSITVEMDEDGDPIGFSLTLHASDHSDPDGENLVWSIAPTPVAIGDPETNGTGNEAVIAYAPEPNYNGMDTFRVQVTDGDGGYGFIGVNVNIRPVNDLPEIPQDAENAEISAPQANNLTLTLDDLTISINDPDSFYPGDFTLSVQDGENYTRSGNTITPSPDFYGTLTVPVILNDGSGDTDVFHVSVKVVRPGDVSGDDVLGIGDVILAFQVLTGTDLGEIAIYSAADVNGDGSIGVAEIIFALTAISTEG